MALCCRPTTVSSQSSSTYDSSSTTRSSVDSYSTRFISTPSFWSGSHPDRVAREDRKRLRDGYSSAYGDAAISGASTPSSASSFSYFPKTPASLRTTPGAHSSRRTRTGATSAQSKTGTRYSELSSSFRSTTTVSSIHTPKKPFWMLIEPEAVAMTFAKYALTFGLADPYSRPDRALALTVFTSMNRMRTAVGMPLLKWSFRLHCLATRSASEVARGSRERKEYAPMNMELARHLLTQPFFRPGEGSVEICRMAQRGDAIAEETAEFWKKAVLCPDYVCCGIGAAESPVGARWCLVAYLVDLETPHESVTITEANRLAGMERVSSRSGGVYFSHTATPNTERGTGLTSRSTISSSGT
eukprot:Lankesteria_metandrocarpae@DN959_c0_g1_i1.p1